MPELINAFLLKEADFDWDSEDVFWVPINQIAKSIEATEEAVVTSIVFSLTTETSVVAIGAVVTSLVWPKTPLLDSTNKTNKTNNLTLVTFFWAIVLFVVIS